MLDSGTTKGSPPPTTHTHTCTHIFAGVYLNLLSGDSSLPQGDTTAMTKHLRSQIRLNVIFLFYSLTTGATIAYNSQSIEAYASVTYMLGEIVYRVYSIHLLSNLKAQYEEEDYFPQGISETGCNPQKDGFCPSTKSRLPLLDTFARWVCGFRRFLFELFNRN